MTKRDIEQILETGYIKPTGDDWFKMVMGTFVGMGIYGGAGSLLLMKLDSPTIILWTYLLLLLLLIVYLYWRDGQIKIIKTGLTKNENLDILKNVFRQLDWGMHVYANEVEIEDNKYILKFIRATLVYTDNFIGYNFQYSATDKSGRPAFFIGIRTYLKMKFENKLKTFIKL